MIVKIPTGVMINLGELWMCWQRVRENVQWRSTLGEFSSAVRSQGIINYSRQTDLIKTRNDTGTCNFQRFVYPICETRARIPAYNFYLSSPASTL